MSVNPVGWFEIYVQDMDRAKLFYEKVFQRSLSKLAVPDMDMWAFEMDTEQWGASGALIKLDGCPSGGSGTIVYFSCVDCAVEAGRVIGAGGQIHRSKFSVGQYGFIALVVDTEGNMIGLHSLE